MHRGPSGRNELTVTASERVDAFVPAPLPKDPLLVPDESDITARARMISLLMRPSAQIPIRAFAIAVAGASIVLKPVSAQAFG